MKKPSRFLRVFGVAGLLISLLAATIAPVGAQDEDGEPLDDFIADLLDVNDGMFRTGDNAIFYPWVANGEDFGLGASQTSISVQNLEAFDGSIAIYVGDGDGGYTLETTAFLSAYAAKTFHADDLGIEEGTGAPVVVIGFDEFTSDGELDEVFVDLEPGEALVETPVILSKPEGVLGDFTQVVACVINDGAGNPVGFAVAAPFEFDTDDDGVAEAFTPGTATEPNYFVGAFTQAELQEILEDANADDDGVDDELINPFGGFNNDADCSDEGIAGSDGGDFLFGVTIGGVAKQAVTGDSLPTTTEADTAVSGYNALNGVELAQFDQFYLPIVQTNCGPGGCWDSVIRVANLEGENNAVTIRFFPADDGSGSLQTGFQIQDNVDGGSTWNVNLSDLVPEGWVGSAHILSDGGVFAMVDRYKVGYNMWITNTGSSADFENLSQIENSQGDYVLFAPHVLLDYFGWNTGINVANLADADNNVSIQYFNLLGNATEVLNQRLAAHGMTYFYDPSVGAQDNNEQDVTNDPNANTVGSALIWSDEPVAAAVDATKYPETDPNGGEDLFQATSYSATANVFTWQAVPLVQKGSPVDGLGDTSGINIMNPNSVAVTANVYYVNPSGFDAQNFGQSSVTIPAFANGFVYTMTQRNLPNGFTGAAQVVASAPVAAVSANVNYAVDGDGSAIFNAFNPCGLFRSGGLDGDDDGDADCSFGDVFAPGGQSVTKTFIVDDGDDEDETEVGDAEGVAGVGFSINSVEGSTDFGFQRDGFSQTDGSLTFDNIPVGEYELFVTSVPEGFTAPDPLVAMDTFSVSEGEDVTLINELEEVTAGFTKTVVVAGTGDDIDQDGEIDAGTGNTIAGVDVVVFETTGEGTAGDPVLGEVAFTGTTGADGSVSGDLTDGAYVLCLFDADASDTVASTGETVVATELGATADGSCVAGFDEFTAGDDIADDLVNEVVVTGLLGGLTIITSDDGVAEGDVDVELFELAAGDVDCADVVFGTDTGTIVTTDAITGEVILSGQAAGTYCVVADFDGDGSDIDDVQGIVVVADDTSQTVTIDVGQDTFVVVDDLAVPATLNVTTTTDGTTIAPGVEVSVIALGTFADCGVAINAVSTAVVAADFTGTTDVDGTVSFDIAAAGTFCVGGDFDGGGTVDDASNETVTLTLGAATDVVVTDQG